MHYCYSGRLEFTVMRDAAQIGGPLCFGEFCESVDKAKKCWIVWCVAKSAEGLLCVHLTRMQDELRVTGIRVVNALLEIRIGYSRVLPAAVEVRPQITQANK